VEYDGSLVTKLTQSRDVSVPIIFEKWTDGMGGQLPLDMFHEGSRVREGLLQNGETDAVTVTHHARGPVRVISPPPLDSFQPGLMVG